jgi:hypothetical protein
MTYTSQMFEISILMILMAQQMIINCGDDAHDSHGGDDAHDSHGGDDLYKVINHI